MSSQEVDPSLITLIVHGNISKYFTVAPFTMMFYDIWLTFPVEVEKIWKQRFSGLTVLWVLWLNKRFEESLGVPCLCDIYGHRCAKTYKFPGLLDLGQRLVVGTIFTLRIYCIYNRNIYVTLLVVLFILVELAFKIFVAAQLATPVIAPAGQGGCFESTSPELTRQTLGFWITELTTDGAVLCLTAFRVYVAYWRHRQYIHNTLWRVIFMDDYASEVFHPLPRFKGKIFINASQTELKPVAGPLGAYITSTLVSRLILNLKVAGSEDSNLGTESSMLTSLGTNTRVEELIFGNMVNEMEDSSESATSMNTHSSRDSYKLKTLRRV
ncbi:transmembrane [Pyrrhoderma noxium]|uniref:Transmembrane n=1 Tax=Pyrrhoderma noxium TaxID=2282107 RepID=A0A286UIS1_9AGAM|nr:transmembrane [Pyrrhoderma noxium]